VQILASTLGRRIIVGAALTALAAALVREVAAASLGGLPPLVALAVALLVGAVGGGLLAGSIVPPVLRLLQAAARIRVGDLVARVEPAPPDELGDLAFALADLSKKLWASAGGVAEERNTLAAVLEAMDDGVLMVEGSGGVLLANPAAERILQVPPGQALGRGFVEVLRQHQLVELVRGCLGARRAGAIQMVELGLPRRYLRVQAAPLGEGRGLVVLQDLTELRRTETIRRDFVANVSHELRTPLASLKALVETLQDGALEDPPAARLFLERMNVEVDGLTQLVRELLELSRIESGQASLRIAPTDVSELLRQVVERLRAQVDRAGLTIDCEEAPDLPLMPVDADRLQTAVSNLVHNAIKFTASGGEIRVLARAARVRLDASFEILPSDIAGPMPTHVILTVSDTGVGIPSEEQTRVFERFYKADRARSGGGTGLGLAIVKHVAEAHGGRTWVESVEGEGSSFHIALPLPQLGARGLPATRRPSVG
jgi:two-component system phosphate regulon sensor histidine kinase PhoR